MAKRGGNAKKTGSKSGVKSGKKVSLPVRLVKKSKAAPAPARTRPAPLAPRSKEERREAVNREIAGAIRISRPAQAQKIDLMPPRETPAMDTAAGRRPGLGKVFKSFSGRRKERILTGGQSAEAKVFSGPDAAADQAALKRLRAEVDPVKEDRAKRMMMYSGVLFFMLLITGGWLYNMKQSFNRSRLDASQNFSITEWRELTFELGEKIEQMKEGLNEINSFASESEAADGSLPPAGDKEPFISTSTLKLTPEEIETLKDKLAELENATSTVR